MKLEEKEVFELLDNVTLKFNYRNDEGLLVYKTAQLVELNEHGNYRSYLQVCFKDNLNNEIYDFTKIHEMMDFDLLSISLIDNETINDSYIYLNK